MIYPPLKSHFSLPLISVETAKGEKTDLLTLVKSQQTNLTLLIPGFTACHGTCPLQVQAYKKILSEFEQTPSISVVFFSFNPKESSQSLQDFHTSQKLPDSWIFLRADEENTQLLLDTLQFTTMKTGDSFDHPVQTFAFSADGTWIGSLFGLDVTKEEVEKVYQQAEMKIHSPITYMLISKINNPNSIAIMGGTGFVLSFLFLFYFLNFRSRKFLGLK